MRWPGGSRIMKWMLTAGLCLTFLCSVGQVVHNFEMGPENTDCGGLDSLELAEQELAEKIVASTFRLREEMQISRYSAPRRFIYASCDGETGYLLAYQTDSLIHVYYPVGTGEWEVIRDAADPRESFRNKKELLKRIEN